MSPFSGVKMRTLLLVAALGLLAVVHSTPVDFLAVSQSPATSEDGVIHEVNTDGFTTIVSASKKPEDEVIQEVITDGFLVISSTSQSPKTNTAFQTSQQPPSDSKETDLNEGNPNGDPNDKVSMDSSESNVESATIQSHQPDVTSVVNEAWDTSNILVSQTTEPNVSSGDNLSSDLVHDEGKELDQNIPTDASMTPSSNAENTTASVNSPAPHDTLMVITKQESGSEDISGIETTAAVPDLFSSEDGFTIESSFTSPTPAATESELMDLTPDTSGLGSGDGFTVESSFTSPTPAATESELMDPTTDTSGLGSGDGFTVETSFTSPTPAATESKFIDTTPDASGLGSGDGFPIETSFTSPTPATTTSELLYSTPETSGSGSGDVSIIETSFTSPTPAATESKFTDITAATTGLDSGDGGFTINTRATSPTPTTVHSTFMGRASTDMSASAPGSEEGFVLKSNATASLSTATNGTLPKGRNLIQTLGLPNKTPGLTDPANVDTQHKGHSTPGWIIIVAFIVGVGALVMVCVAIATRDKWNAPNQTYQVETKTNSTNQQMELEMETFLEKDKPMENGKAAEYRVIPLEELQDNYS
ncbi:mucin-12-like isoform X2 [Mugil cephalus]|uniref:mucin-12-like isoform X2 n=1 Tax=Mugil cephalus TaxID=48193 RepID=UPI001FB63770|nr:mucin-12-like isoform X2 [Mugil cephalus]